MAAILSTQRICAGYGANDVLHDIDIMVEHGEIVTLIGANGAGKTTLMMTICGKPRAGAGQVIFDGEDITQIATHRIMRMGLAHSPEGRHVFARMSVQENLLMGAYFLSPAETAREYEKIFLLFPRLKDRLAQRAGTLSGGEQQMLAIARALMAQPRLLLLDEPSLGLAPLITKQIFAALGALNRDFGLSILLVEQNAHLALRCADRGYVLVNGRITMQGTGEELLARPEIQAAYLEGG